MIKTVGEMLEALRRAEAAKLDASDIRHAPTIGSMYEGLTRSLLERAVPASMDLRIVSGFVVDGRGGTSGQLDCMLVSGEGTAVPYVDGVYQWHVRDVLAVFEVKKNLFGGDLSDAHGQLLNVVNTYSSWVQNAHEATAVNVRASMRAYAECVGTVLPAPDDWETMDRAKHLIWHTISMDQLAPVRIVLGYGGYSTEAGLRNGFLKFIEANLNKLGYGPPALPNLIVADGVSLVKLSGHPYHAPCTPDGWWPIIASTDNNPTHLILELLWTRISYRRAIVPWFGEDLELERLSPLINARPQERTPGSDQWGWMYRPVSLTAKELVAGPSKISWEPVELDLDQFVVIDRLCREDVYVTDPDLLASLDRAGRDPGAFFASLIATSLVAREGDKLVLNTIQCQTVILPDGRYIAAENNSGRLERWLRRYMAERSST